MLRVIHDTFGNMHDNTRLIAEIFCTNNLCFMFRDIKLFFSILYLNTFFKYKIYLLILNSLVSIVKLI